jgi:signal transduction histidine kinase
MPVFGPGRTRPGPVTRGPRQVADPAGTGTSSGYPSGMVGPEPRRWHRSTGFDAMISGLVVLLTVVPILGNPGLGPPAWIGLGMAAAVLGRRRYPLSVMAAVSALGLLQILLFPPAEDPKAYDMAVLIAMYSVVKYSRPLWHAFLAAAPVLIGIVIEVLRHVDRKVAAADPVRVWVWVEASAFLVAVCTAVWLTGYVSRTRRNYLIGLEDRAATAERERDHLATIAVAQERANIARDLHDVVAHSMAVMIVQADGARYALGTDLAQSEAAMAQVAATGREALEDMGRLVEVLRGTNSTGAAGETDRRRIGLDQIGSLAERARSAGLSVEITEQGARVQVPAAVELTVFRIVQEALTNVLRHAGPTAGVRLGLGYRAGAVHLEVVDDGAGRPVSAPAPGAGGHGLVGMRERVTVHSGTFEAGPRLGGGCARRCRGRDPGGDRG